MRIRRMIFTILQPDDGDSALSRIFDWLVTALILTSVVIVFAATFNLPSGTMRVLSAIEAVASVVFTIEYALLHRYYDAMRSLGEVVVLKKRELLGSIY